MKHPLALAVPCALVLAATAAARRPASADPVAPAATALSGDAGASLPDDAGGGDAGVAATPKPSPRAPRRFLEGFPASDAPSPKPEPMAWGEAEPLAISRPRPGCSAFRIREYVRITCFDAPGDPAHNGGSSIYGARVVGGSEKGVEVIAPVWEAKRPFSKLGVDLAFPVRRGDRRAIVVAESIPRWKSTTPDEGVRLVISETWLPGAPGPTIVLD